MYNTIYDRMQKKAKSFIFEQIKKYYRFFLLLLVGVIGSSVVGLFYPYFTSKIVNNAIYDRNMSAIGFYLIIFVIIYAVHQLFHFLRVLSYEKLNEIFTGDIKEMMFSSILKLDGNEYSKINVGDVLKRINNDSESILRFVYFNVIYYITDLVEFVVQLAFIAIISIPVFVLVLICMPLSYFFTKFFVNRSKKKYKDLAETESKLSSFLLELLNNLSSLRLMNCLNWINNKFRLYNEKNNASTISSKKCEVENKQVIAGIALIIHLMLFVLSAWLIINDNLKLGSFLAVIEYFDASLIAFSDIVGRGNPIAQDFVSIQRIMELLELKSENYNYGESITINNGNVVVDESSFSYGSDVGVLKKCSLEVRSGEHVAIVGMNGSGKTTLVHTLLRLYNINSGNILIDGVNINDYSLQSLREQIAIVLQKVLIFDGTIRFNVSLSDDKNNDDAIWDCLEVLGLKDYFKSLPDQLDTMLYADEKFLSDGEVQRIGIARVIMKNAGIIIFDEATSSLDKKNEAVIAEICGNLFKNKTMIIVTHEPNNFNSIDKYVFMDNGEILDIGSKSELEQRCPEFRELFC